MNIKDLVFTVFGYGEIVKIENIENHNKPPV